MDQAIKKRMQERITSKQVTVGLNSTLRASKKGEVETIIYASNISDDILSIISSIDVPRYEYDGDSESLSIACGKSFNITVLGLKR